MPEEKRQSPRVKVHAPVQIRSDTGNAPILGQTADLSLGGVYIEMLFTLEVGTQLDISLQIGESTVLAAGEVVTCDRTVGNGIRFVRMLPEDRQELYDFLQALQQPV
jgi:c-di-GMP-binding flagellar brake protein YcgR